MTRACFRLGSHQTVVGCSPVTTNGRLLIWSRKSLLTSGNAQNLCEPGNGVYAFTISGDSRFLAASRLDGTATVWRLDTAASPRVVRHLHGNSHLVTALCLSHDGRFLIGAGHNSRVSLWDLARQDNGPVYLSGNKGSTTLVAITGDRQWALAAHSDGTLHAWNLRMDELLEYASCLAGRNLSQGEWEEYLNGVPFRSTFDEYLERE